MKNRPRAVILHIPKTGGTSFRTAALRNYRREEVFLHYPNAPGFSTFAQFWAQGISRVQSLRLIMGHFTVAALPFAPGPSKIVTMVREPRARALSRFHHQLRKQNSGWPKAAEDDLAAFLHKKRIPDIDNGLCRFLSGVSAPWGKCSQAMLDTALENLHDRFDLVGITERYSESIAMIGGLLGWEAAPIQHLNRAPKPHSKPSDEAEELLDRLTSLDRVLYTHALLRFEEQRAAAPVLAASARPPSGVVLQRCWERMRIRWKKSRAGSIRGGRKAEPFCEFEFAEGRLLGRLRNQRARRNRRVELFLGNKFLGHSAVTNQMFELQLPYTEQEEEAWIVLRNEDGLALNADRLVLPPLGN